MPRTQLIALVLLLTTLLGEHANAEEAQPGDTITWSKDLPSALAKAKEVERIVMVCVNAKHVDGRKDEEPAAKALRDVIYKDPRIVEKSRAFVCVLLTPEGSSDEYGELRALGVEGKLVSPQHIFISPDGTRILHRKSYWSHKGREAGVTALLALMATAEQKLADGAPPEDPAVPAPEGAPSDDTARAEWIARLVDQVVTREGAQRDAALSSLIEGDQDGDCIQPLVAVMAESKKNPSLLVAIIRAMGRDGLVLAAQPIAAQLTHRRDEVRGNAAVSLEYIGCREKKVISALKKFVGKEKDEFILNHGFRALGRCGSEDAKVRALLLKKAESAKSEFASYGPCIGLAYVENDKKVARGVEKLLKKMGVPGSRRGGGQNAVKRSLVSWTLASVGDEKSATFVREELMSGLEHVRAEWVAGLLGFWRLVARCCEGERELLPSVEDGVRGAVSYVKGADLGRYGAETRNLMDDYRKGRDAEDFVPKGDNVLNDEPE